MKTYPMQPASSDGLELPELFVRSEGLRPGACRRLGAVHLHIDGTGNLLQLSELLRELERKGGPSKLSRVSDARPGPQRERLVDTYRSHTPGSFEFEEFSFFSSTLLKHREFAVESLRFALDRLQGVRGAVVEVERVVATVDEDGTFAELDLDEIASLRSEEIGRKKAGSLPFEVHHAIEVPKTEEPPGVSVDELLDLSEEEGIEVGGWFCFEKDDVWSFRSNGFFERDRITDLTREQNERLRAAMMRRGLEFRLWTILERVLGIWRTHA